MFYFALVNVLILYGTKNCHKKIIQKDSSLCPVIFTDGDLIVSLLDLCGEKIQYFILEIFFISNK